MPWEKLKGATAETRPDKWVIAPPQRTPRNVADQAKYNLASTLDAFSLIAEDA